MQVQAWSMTDVGQVRQHNEDACVTQIGDQVCLGVVCDGMGGANAGEVASRIAADTFTQVVMAGGFPPEELMRAALEDANREVYCHSWEHPECRGMGTTLVASAVMGDTAYILNVGDSRAYSIRAHEIRQITQDHSLVAELVRQGAITPEAARYHPRKNIITRALGTERSVTGDLFIHKVAPGEVILLCSDGLTNELTDQELLAIVRARHPMEESCGRLINEANSRGARDNITAVLMELRPTTEE